MAWTQAESTLLRRNVRAAFFNELEGPDLDLAGLLATTISTEDPTEDYAWLGNVPAIREFKGDRIVRSIPTEKVSLSDKTWEGTVGFDRHTIEDGKLGQVEMRIRDLAVRARQHKNRRMTDVMEAGAATVGYDGQYYFDSDHPSNKAGGSNRSNLLTQSITAATRITAAEAEIAIAQFVEHFTLLLDDQGEPMGMTSSGMTIVCHATQWKGFAIAAGLIDPGKFGADASAVSGAYQGLGATVLVNPYMTAEEIVYVFKADGVIKPFIFQDRLPIDLDDNLDGDQFFRSNKAEFGTRARYEVGYGPWERSAHLTLS